MKKIGLFCGCFNPVHNGHIMAAESFKKAAELDCVYLVPANSQYSKFSGYVENGQHRLEMCALAVEDHDGIEVCDFEIRSPEVLYTMDTVIYMKTLYPDAEIFLCMGVDTAEKICLWACFDELKKNVKFLIASRYENNNHTDGLYTSGADVAVVEHEIDGISSTKVRKKLRAGETTIPELNKKVICYIRDHSLYSR